MSPVTLYDQLCYSSMLNQNQSIQYLQIAHFIYFALVQRPPGVTQSWTQSCFELRFVFEDLKQFLREIILRCSSKIPLGLSDCLYV